MTTDNTGQMPLPKKKEGGLGPKHYESKTVGRNGQGPSGMGTRKQPIHRSGTSGHGTKTHNSVSR